MIGDLREVIRLSGQIRPLTPYIERSGKAFQSAKKIGMNRYPFSIEEAADALGDIMP
jgi:hypothetical protein